MESNFMYKCHLYLGDLIRKFIHFDYNKSSVLALMNIVIIFLTHILWNNSCKNYKKSCHIDTDLNGMILQYVVNVIWNYKEKQITIGIQLVYCMI